jgi:DNA (cytosine-5)-methyltransferase 1
VNELALFAGAGGGILGGKLLGWRTVCAVELNPYARSILISRQRDGVLPRFPIWDDIKTFDGRTWRGCVDVVSGGFPCQDISTARTGKRLGLSGTRSGLWSEMARVVSEVQPKYVFVENSPALTSRGLGTVLGDLAQMGYNARWGVVGADHLGGPHRRDRIWIVAYSMREGRRGGDLFGWGIGDDKSSCGLREDELRGIIEMDEGDGTPEGDARVEIRGTRRVSESEREEVQRGEPWNSFSPPPRVVNGMAHRVDRLRAVGNGQVPVVAASAWNILTKGI